MRRIQSTCASLTGGPLSSCADWDVLAAALPKPILLASTDADIAEESDDRDNGWLFRSDSDMVSAMAVNNRGGKLRWSRPASYWLRENSLSPSDLELVDFSQKVCAPVRAARGVTCCQSVHTCVRVCCCAHARHVLICFRTHTGADRVPSPGRCKSART